MATPPSLLGYEAFVIVRDHEGKYSDVSVNISSTNYTAYLSDTGVGAVYDWITATAALSYGVISKKGVRLLAYDISSSTVSNEAAINTAALLVIGQDTVTGKPWRSHIPSRKSDGTAYTSTRGIVNLTAGSVPTYLTKVASLALSEDGNPVLVQSMKVTK